MDSNRREIVCYNCAEIQEISVQEESTLCTRCAYRLDLIDLVVDGNWKDELVSVGDVIIRPHGRILGGHIIANNILMEGVVAGGRLKASRCLDIRESARLSLENIEALDLVIGEHCQFTLNGEERAYRNIELFGMLNASIKLSGNFNIHATASFFGKIKGGKLKLEDGATFIADVLQ